MNEENQGLEKIVAKCNRYFINPLREVNLGDLCESNVECLTASFNENKFKF